MKRFRTNKVFDKEHFAEGLNSIGVKAYADSDGVVFDDIAFAEIPAWALPCIVLTNRKSMMSENHTEAVSE